MVDTVKDAAVLRNWIQDAEPVELHGKQLDGSMSASPQYVEDSVWPRRSRWPRLRLGFLPCLQWCAC